MRVAAGKLRDRVLIRAHASSADSHGQMVAAWNVTVEDNVPALVEYGPGGESIRERSQQDAGDVVTVLMRYRSDLTNKMRIEHESRVLNIVNVNPDRLADTVLVTCKREQ